MIKEMKNKGFTLIELLVVIAIISILVTIVVIAIDPEKLINDTNDTKDRSELNQVKTSLQLFFNEQDSYPTALTELETGNYIRQLPSFTIDYGTDAGNTDYDAGISVNNPGPSDADSVTKCTSDPANYASGDYMICPD